MSTNTHPTQPTTAQPSAPAPAAQAVDEPLKNWAFPFTPVDSKQDASDPMTYMKALASAEDGFFPLGASGMLHGGIHFDQNTAKLLNQDEGIRAIADGEVVAYRLDSAYPEQVYKDGRHASYSTSFVLIRHKLALPPVPARAAASTAQGQTTAQPASGSHGASAPQAASTAQPASTSAAAPPKKAAPDETLTFFSLYMHLTDYATYQAAQTREGVAGIDTKKLNLASMPYWQGDRYYRVGEKAQDKQAVPKPKQATPAPSPTYDPLGAFIDDNYTVPPSPVDDEPPPPPPVVGLRICNTPNGKVIGVLPKGAELIASDTETHRGWVKIKSLKSGQPVAGMVGKTVDAHAPWSWVPLAGLDLVVDPQPRDTVVVLKNPYPVKAGEIVGEPGHYLRYTDAKVIKGATVRSLVHLEVFAGRELKEFIDKSRHRATEARDAEQQAKDGLDLPGAKTLMEVSPGALLVTTVPERDQKVQPPAGGLKLAPVAPARGGRWVLVQPQEKKTSGGHHPHVTFQNVGTKIWVDAKLANTTTADLILGWTNFPLSLSKVKGPGADFREVFRRADLDKLGADNIAVDEHGTRWWYIKLGSKDGSDRQGWVCEKDHALVRMCGPWDWPGFELVDNTGFKPVEMLKRYLYATDQYLPGESASDFEPSALAVNAGELIIKLEKAVDANHDGKVTAQELRHAQETPWIAEAISHLAVRSETEWGGGLGKWNDLSPLMKKLLWLWQAEVERIGKLQWWEQAASVAGFPKDTQPWHLHPIALVGNFASFGGAAKTISEDGVYFIYMQEHLANVTNRLHWPGGDSGVTLGPGYDMKARSAESIIVDMKAIGIDDSTAHAISGAAGLHGPGAKAFCLEHAQLVNLSDNKQADLLHKVLPPYIHKVNSDIKIDLTKNQFDALVSYAYNPGGGWSKVADMVNRGDVSSAMDQIRKYVYSGGQKFDGLVKRRNDETTLYTTGRYEYHGEPLPAKQ
ncbi:glycoside hydrolase family protein [Paraburkholderia bannensis]|uniref:glycoside hydrolase family protein n=1 Tax=Paraburkholderia bannensis TaxID=765414 RepID=UPI0005AA30B7|nr:glycoside hydrolase family protein [Paraburkholderia bannensis]